MISYFERYQEFASAGYQNSRVWTELTSLGDEIRQEPLYSDARAVAFETMTRAKHNVEVLIERLHTLEYHFLYPQEIWNTPEPDTTMALDAFEAQYGLLPLSIRMWYEVVGSLCLMGSHPKLSYMDSFDSGASNPIYSDPLVINPLNDPPLPFYADMIFDYTGEGTTDPPYGIWLAPDAIQKANHSGGGPTQIMFPNPVMDAPLISEQWDGVLFVSYLQKCFQWGGFPGLRDYPDYPKEELDFLTRDLLPL
jgi:hypothetical protein